MKTSQYLTATLKETPADADTVSHQLMLRAGLIRQLSTGIYTWLPTGLRILQKIIQMVRDEMNSAGAQEIIMPSVIPEKLRQETDRQDVYGDELLKIRDQHNQSFCYGPTHEEVITDIARRELRSYRQLPIIFYQIQTKFRDEIRPRFGVIRGREFIMKDAYSFHVNDTSLKKTYQLMYDTYLHIFSRLKLRFMAVRADTDDIGGSTSHEFQALAEIGDDQILYNDVGSYAANIEIAEKEGLKEGDKSPDGQGRLKMTRSIEVGHIFQLGKKYSDSMKAVILNENNESVSLSMGCYGIGISRIVAALIEQNHDDRGIIWPEVVAPFDIVIIPIGLHQNDRVRQKAESLYKRFLELNYAVLLDDRDERAGRLFSDAELIGIPNQIIISENTLQQNSIEYKSRSDLSAIPVKMESLITFLNGLP